MAKKAATKTAPAKGKASKAKAAKEEVAENTVPAAQVIKGLLQLKEFIDEQLGSLGVADDGETEEGDAKPTREEREAELQEWTPRALRTALIEAGYAAEDVKAEKDKANLIANLINEEYGEDEEEPDSDEEDEDEESEDEEGSEDDEDEDDDEDDEDDEDEDDELDRDALMGMSLTELKKLAKSERFGYGAADLKDLDKDGIVDLLLEEAEDEDEEDEEEEEEDYYTEADYKKMNEAELREIAKEAGVKLKKTDKKKEIIAKLLAE